LAGAGNWDNVVIARDEWAKMKPAGIADGSLAFGQIPCYQDDKVQMVQMNAILRHIGRRFDAYGSNDQEKAQVDMAMDGVEDGRGAYLKIIYGEKMAEDKVKAYAATLSDTSVYGGGFLKYLSAMLKRCGGKYIATADKPSIADYSAMDLIRNIVRMVPDALKEHKDLADWLANMEGRKNIKEYIESKPACRETVNGNGLG